MEATPEETAEGRAIVRVLAAVLDRLVCANAPMALVDPGQVTKFSAMKAPGIAIEQYLERIQKYASCSNECFILALIYIDRLIQRNNFVLMELNVHRVIITSVLLAAKFFDDAYYNNAYYAKVGGVLVSEINGLEVDFLFRINFSLHVTPAEFEKYKAELLVHSVTTVAPVVQVVSPEVQAMQQPMDEVVVFDETTTCHHDSLPVHPAHTIPVPCAASNNITPPPGGPVVVMEDGWGFTRANSMPPPLRKPMLYAPPPPQPRCVDSLCDPYLLLFPAAATYPPCHVPQHSPNRLAAGL